MSTPIRLHIDRLVLDGITLAPADANLFQAALVETLGDLLRVERDSASATPAMAPLSTRQSHHALRAPAITTAGSPTALGQAVAHAVHAGLTTRTHEGGPARETGLARRGTQT